MRVTSCILFHLFLLIGPILSQDLAGENPSSSSTMEHIPPHMKRKVEAHNRADQERILRIVNILRKLTRNQQEIECVDGMALGTFGCMNMNLVSYIPGDDLGSTYAGDYEPGHFHNDNWGWTDPEDGTEYALVGMFDGTSLVDISKPNKPKVLGFIETASDQDEGYLGIWRDIKVVNNVAYIGSEILSHGIQVFDLTRLRDIRRRIIGGVPRLEPDYVATETGSTHNIVAFPEIEKILGVGLRDKDPTCVDEEGNVASFAIYDVSGEYALAPRFEGCFYGFRDFNIGYDYTSFPGYVHDAHCVTYHGPDTNHTGENICALFAEGEIAIVNFDSATVITKFTYDTAYYSHQGWFSEDHSILYANDELDELYGPYKNGPHTYIWDISDLDNPSPTLTPFITSTHPSIDHNLYTKDGYVYSANYNAGARVYKILQDGSLQDAAYWDTITTCAALDGSCDEFGGVWTHYPFFDSGVTIATSIMEGLFIFRPILEE